MSLGSHSPRARAAEAAGKDPMNATHSTIAEALRCHPRPWTQGSNDGEIRDAEKNVIIITSVWDRTTDHVAALIVRAVNSYDAMREALRTIANQSLGDDWTAEQAISFVRQHAKAALKLAEGEQ